MSPDQDGCAGFTLLEALIAMVVLTTVAAVLLRGIVDIRDDAAWFEGHIGATLVATSVLNEALADRHLPNGTHEGERDGFRYSMWASNADMDAQLALARPDTSTSKPITPANTDSTSVAPPLWRPQRLIVTVQAPLHPVIVETARLAAVP